MKIKRVVYNDDGVLIEGILIRRIFCKPIFVPANADCGFDQQIINKNQVKNITLKQGE